MFTRRPLHRWLGPVLALLFVGSLLGEPRGMAMPGAQEGIGIASGPFAALAEASSQADRHADAHLTHHGHPSPAADPVGGHGSHSEGPDPHCQILCATTAVFDPAVVLPGGLLLGLLNPRTPSARIPQIHLLAAAVAHPFLLPFGQAPPTSVL